MCVLCVKHDSFSITKTYTENAFIFCFVCSLCICAVYAIKVLIRKSLGYFLSL